MSEYHAHDDNCHWFLAPWQLLRALRIPGDTPIDRIEVAENGYVHIFLEEPYESPEPPLEA